MSFAPSGSVSVRPGRSLIRRCTYPPLTTHITPYSGVDVRGRELCLGPTLMVESTRPLPPITSIQNEPPSLRPLCGVEIPWPAPLPPPRRVIGPALGILVDLFQRILLLLERLQGGETYSRMGQG